MKYKRVDQILSGFADGDAISQEAILIRDVLQSLGCKSEIYADPKHISATLAAEGRDMNELDAGVERLLVYHYAVSSPASDLFAAWQGPRALIYHNITPGHFFKGFDDALAGRLAKARADLKELAPQGIPAWADSQFNANELKEFGFKDPCVLPLLFEPKTMDTPLHPRIVARLQPRLTTILFVGRLAPNKRIETLIEAFHYYHRGLNPFSRLAIVGSPRSCPRYYTLLRMLVDDLGVPNVCFEGFAAPNELPSYYRCSDLFVSTSEHEGYCLPLVEAMHAGISVLAHATGGTPEAMDGAGVLYEDMETPELAALIGRILSDESMKAEILSSQAIRIERARKRDPAEELTGLVEKC